MQLNGVELSIEYIIKIKCHLFLCVFMMFEHVVFCFASTSDTRRPYLSVSVRSVLMRQRASVINAVAEAPG